MIYIYYTLTYLYLHTNIIYIYVRIFIYIYTNIIYIYTYNIYTHILNWIHVGEWSLVLRKVSCQFALRLMVGHVHHYGLSVSTTCMLSCSVFFFLIIGVLGGMWFRNRLGHVCPYLGKVTQVTALKGTFFHNWKASLLVKNNKMWPQLFGDQMFIYIYYHSSGASVSRYEHTT